MRFTRKAQSAATTNAQKRVVSSLRFIPRVLLACGQ
jgi:hypothetical protein